METGIPIHEISGRVEALWREAPVVDIHTHLFDPAFGPLCLRGIDELLTYHYLVAELLRARPDLAPARFWAMGKREQADMVWRELFVRRSPLSEACRGILTVLQRMGLEPGADCLASAREYFAGLDARAHVDTVFELAGVKRVYMTNDPLQPDEAALWRRGFERDPRFLAVLRLDSVLMNWPAGAERLRATGFGIDATLSGPTVAAVRAYLDEWCGRMDARYMAISLPPTFTYPDRDSPLVNLLERAVIPVGRARDIPVALMIGVRKLVNPALRLAGDSVGAADVGGLERLAGAFPDVRFLVTALARENAHALCVAARKFPNLLLFGCWWFLNNPSLIREITAMRVELLGLSFFPQHSDARILDQLIYKWAHSRRILADVLGRQYEELARTGWPVREADIARDLPLLFPDGIERPHGGAARRTP